MGRCEVTVDRIPATGRARSILSAVLVAALCAQLVSIALPTRAAASGLGDYAYWFGYAQTRIYPTTMPPAGSLLASQGGGAGIALGAAQAEFEGRQIAIRPASSGLRDVWIAPTNLVSATGAAIPATRVTVFKVGYVNITGPSYNIRSGGLQPDPLLPMTLANGERLGWNPGGGMDVTRRAVAVNTTQPFYIMFEVPDGTAPGVYSGTLNVSAIDDYGQAAPALAIPVSLTVYPFSIAQRTLQTSFGFNLHRAALANAASRDWLPRDNNPGKGATRVAETTDYHGDQIGGWLKYFSDHRISSQSIMPAWRTQSTGWAPPSDSGDMVARADVLTDYLGTGAATTFAGNRLNFDSVKMPEAGNQPWIVNPFASARYTALAERYYATQKAQLQANGFFGKAYAYPVDEPTYSKRKFVEKYAALIHRAAPGTRVLLTTDPTTMKGKLLKGVDIYVHKEHFVFRDTGWLKKIRKAHKQLWIYPHSTNWQVITPGFLIDEPVTDSRSQGWVVFKSRAKGFLYWNVCNWQIKTSAGIVQRDPYTTPNAKTKTFHGRPMRANGDGSLVYPGYYPALGLNVEGAPPVGSLRMEALRDGLEDYEYLKLVGARYGTPTADVYCGRIVGKTPKPKAGRLMFPAWAKAPESYEQVRAEMAARLSQ